MMGATAQVGFHAAYIVKDGVSKEVAKLEDRTR